MPCIIWAFWGDFVETNRAYSDEMILNIKSSVLDFCCGLLFLKYSILLILARKMLILKHSCCLVFQKINSISNILLSVFVFY